ncbi:MAG: hypothetical protein AAGK97_03575 [Bacteroidota bacterium]
MQSGFILAGGVGRIYGPILGWHDWIVTPIVFLVLLLILIQWRNTTYKDSPIGKYLIPGFIVRVVGSVLSAFMYQYYYNGGDTFGYYHGAMTVIDTFLETPQLGIDLMMNSGTDLSWDAQTINRGMRHPMSKNDPQTMVTRISVLALIPTFRSYIGASLLVSFFAYMGCWRIFKTFLRYYPHLYKRLALATLFIPSVFFFGTGLLKDPITLGCLGFMTYAMDKVFNRRKFSITSLAIIFVCGFIISIIKVYILLGFLAPAVFWVALKNVYRVKNKYIRRLMWPILLAGSAGAGYLGVTQIGASLNERFESPEAILESAADVQGYLKRKTEKAGGTGYDLGEIDISNPASLAKSVPKAINVTLFRPYLWEMSKAINIPAGIEAIGTLFITFLVILKLGLFRFIGSIFKNPDVLFCVAFSLIFAFFVGFATSNFGSMIRYKIPMMPFYFVGMVLLLENSRRKFKLINFKKYS